MDMSETTPSLASTQLFDRLRERLASTLEWLADKPEETATTTARALWWKAAGMPRSAELAVHDPLPDLDAGQLRALDALVARRLTGEPLPYITGRQRFMNLEMYSAPGALIPRKETELLGQMTLALVHQAAAHPGGAIVVDVCTGSGNLAIGYAAHEPRARVFAADLSEEAIAVARVNAQVVGVADAIDFRTGDLVAPFGSILDGQVDVLSCNPPYISTAKVAAMPPEISGHEPKVAFDGGPFGIRVLSRLTHDALRLLKPGGWLTFEVGLGQGPAMRKRLETVGGYGQIRWMADSEGQIRALAAQAGSG